mmetsp:Transcript_59624/g.158672  ORF Transcript_59624/g.158672 Transcript_59624/m.158672 type:complete len:252 (-) Transcript_59624:111-866(-)
MSTARDMSVANTCPSPCSASLRMTGSSTVERWKGLGSGVLRSASGARTLDLSMALSQRKVDPTAAMSLPCGSSRVTSFSMLASDMVKSSLPLLPSRGVQSLRMSTDATRMRCGLSRHESKPRPPPRPPRDICPPKRPRGSRLSRPKFLPTLVCPSRPRSCQPPAIPPRPPPRPPMAMPPRRPAPGPHLGLAVVLVSTIWKPSSSTCSITKGDCSGSCIWRFFCQRLSRSRVCVHSQARPSLSFLEKGANGR